RLLRALHERGETVRAIARQPDDLRERIPGDIEVIAADVLDASSLQAAFDGVDVAYYLIHAMASRHDFQQEERIGAENFSRAAKAANVRRIVYLGGLGSEGLSRHLASRQEVGRILRNSGIPTLEFRASIILGSGSLSFELVRSLVDRLPLLIVPRWASQRTQPIAIEDVIAYLVCALDVHLRDSCTVEIGGSDQVSYLDLMKEYAKQRSLHRYFVPVPVLTPWLSSRWLGLVTPVYARVGRKLIDSLRNETVVTSRIAPTMFPEIRPRGFRDAMARALSNEAQELTETRWSDARSSIGMRPQWGGTATGSRIVDSRSVSVAKSSKQAFRAIERIGGTAGWYYGNWLWHVRGAIDLLLGGAGMRRGRRDPSGLRRGDAVDFWRVDALEPGRMLRLRAEMKVPGRAWLQFEVTGDDARSVIRQTAIFEPRGVAGLLYWYALYPVHRLIFNGMLRGIAGAGQ
ncbi:MAG: SDR family oxidoreductase, partial [Gemmatimonadota bacterium]|nr:SDR family oxidoreductase [Gemmatimonadota bacterium]